MVQYRVRECPILVPYDSSFETKGFIRSFDHLAICAIAHVIVSVRYCKIIGDCELLGELG